MNYQKLFSIVASVLLGFGVGMNLWNSYQGGFVVTAKTLHPEVWAQLNDDGDGTTGGGTATGGTTGGGTQTGGGTGTGGENGSGYPSNPNIIEFSLMEYSYNTYPTHSDYNGKIYFGLNGVVTGLLKDRLYTITIETSECKPTLSRDDLCDKSLQGSYCVEAVLGYR